MLKLSWVLVESNDFIKSKDLVANKNDVKAIELVGPMIMTLYIL